MGTEYLGSTNIINEERGCMFWDDLRNGAVAYPAENFPDRTLEEASNYCRNPSREGDSPWCYRVGQGSALPCNIEFCGKLRMEPWFTE